MNPVVHFEMPYESAERMARFYQSAFGWQTQQLGPEMGNYVLASTAPTEAGRPVQPGTINGGFFARTANGPAHPSVVIAVDDIHAAAAQVKAAGGALLGEPMEIPGVGQYLAFTDTEGNRASMMQPLMAP